MKPITQESVLEILKTAGRPVSFNQLVFYFVLDREKQYVRLEKTLEKLHTQRKIEVIKEGVSRTDVAFAHEYQLQGSAFRFYSFVATTEEKPTE